jgi:hypothetical protein
MSNILKYCAITISLFMISFSVMAAHPQDATISPICGSYYKEDAVTHWVDSCPSGFDTRSNHPHHTAVKIEIDGMPSAIVNLQGSTTIYRGEPVESVTITPPQLSTEQTFVIPQMTFGPIKPDVPQPHALHLGVIETEMVHMLLRGKSELPNGVVVNVNVSAGDGMGNLKNDGSFYSPGAIYELAEESTAACSVFYVTYLMKISILVDGKMEQSLHAPGQSLMITCSYGIVAPYLIYRDPRMRAIYDKDNNIVGWMKSHE